MKINKIYFDMDGVLADFNNGIISHGGQLPIGQDEQSMWDTIRENKHFFNRLTPIPGAIDMFKAIYEKYGNKCELLSAVPKPAKQIVTASEDKKEWAKRFIGSDTVVNLVYRDEKKNFCKGKDDILIDDFEKNISEWENSGGIGILFTTPENVLMQIAEIEQG